MTFRFTHIDLEACLGRAFDAARQAATVYGAPALIFAESGHLRSTGYSFTRRGGQGARWASRWSGVRSEVSGASSLRFTWREGLDEPAWAAVAEGRAPSAGSASERPFHGEPVHDELTDDDYLVRRFVDAASAASRFKVVEAEVRRLERTVLICRDDGSPVLRREQGVRWRLRILPDGSGPFEWTACETPDVPEAWAITAVESVLNRGPQDDRMHMPKWVWLAPAAAAVWLHEVIGHTMEADYPLAPTTDGNLAGLEVWTVPFRAGATDDEGYPERRFRLIGAGSGTTRLSDAYHAAQSGLPLTGNGRRQDFRYPVLPRIGALRADRTSGPLPSDLLEGRPFLRVESILSGQVDPITHRFALDVGRAEILDGAERTVPTAGIRLVGDVATALAGIRAVGRESAPDDPAAWPRRLCLKQGQVVETANFSPTLLLEGLDVVD